MSFSDPISVGSASFSRLSEGTYLSSTSSLDEPEMLTIQNQVKPGSNSRFTVKYTKNRNVVGQTGQPIPADDVLAVYCTFVVPHRSFPDTEVAAIYNLLDSFLTDANIAKVLRGER